MLLPFDSDWTMEQTGKGTDGSVRNWTVYRQDDHGNQFVVATQLSRDDAEQLVANYEARGHKQHYWAEGVGRESGVDRTDIFDAGF